MEIIVWIVTGGALGWLSYSLLNFNGGRGRNVSIALGVTGALIGAKAIAPMFLAAPAPGLDAAALLIAAGAASALLVLGDLVYSRWGV